MEIVPAASIDAAQHDELIARAPMGTFLHTRRYLAYHEARWHDVSLALRDDGGALLGVLPAAVDPQEERRVVSHPGLSYGGIVHDGRLRGARMVDALAAICRRYADQGFHSLRYKKVPYIYERAPSGDDVYGLFRLGARRYRCDLLSTIDLLDRPRPSERRRRGLGKAAKARVEVREGAEFIPLLWPVLEENLMRRHGVAPVHTAAEIAFLHSRFPDNISFVVGLAGGEVQAGAVLFSTPRVAHAQYIASSAAGYEMSVLDAVFEHCIAQAQAKNIRFFDFGSSTEREGRHLNEGLFQFKSEFGAGAVAHDFYEVDLTKPMES